MRVRIEFSFIGKNYFGYQKQINKITIQEVIEETLFMVLGEKINLVASGRTDAGVSAIKQVAHFDCNKIIQLNKLSGRLNSMLPKDIRILSCEEAPDNFHARFNAKRKTYIYNFYISSVNIPYYDQFALLVKENISISKIQSGCNILIGKHDFSSFCASNSGVENKERTIYYASIEKTAENLYRLVICGDGFLYNMVRIIMGTLLDLGNNKISIEDFKNIIDAKDREKACKTVSSIGLVLCGVDY